MIPNIHIVVPKCLEEVDVLLKWAINKNAPVAIRYPKGGNIIDTLSPIKEVVEGQWEIVNRGSKVCIIATGRMVQHAMLAKEFLYEKGLNPTVINATFVKPIDKKLLENIKKEGYNILTIEDNIIKGGLGSAVKDYLSEIDYKGTIRSLGYDDEFIPQGNVEILYKTYKLDYENISKIVMKLYD
jgi:1-deoxy-D-xylulose-5-phosphate synthase